MADAAGMMYSIYVTSDIRYDSFFNVNHQFVNLVGVVHFDSGKGYIFRWHKRIINTTTKSSNRRTWSLSHVYVGNKTSKVQLHNRADCQSKP